MPQGCSDSNHLGLGLDEGKDCTVWVNVVSQLHKTIILSVVL